MTAPDPTLVRHIARPRPAVAAAATAPTKSKAINGAGPGRYVPQIQANAIDANRSAPSTTLPATKSAQLRSLPGRKELNPIVPESLSHYDRLQAQVAVAVAYRGRPVGR